MAKAFVCDRCGKVVYLDPTPNMVGKTFKRPTIYSLSIAFTDSANSSFAMDRKMELCQECRDDLSKWMSYGIKHFGEE